MTTDEREAVERVRLLADTLERGLYPIVLDARDLRTLLRLVEATCSAPSSAKPPIPR